MKVSTLVTGGKFTGRQPSITSPRQSFLLRFSMLVIVLFTAFAGQAQLSITSNGVAFTENFNSMGSSSTAALPTGFKVNGNNTTPDWNTGTTATSQAYGSSGTGVVTSSSGGGTVNWANGVTASATDRALGFLTSGSYASPSHIILKITNNTGGTIESLAIAFDYEKYRSGSRAFDWTFFHGSASNPATAAASGNQSYAADANNTVVSNPPLSTNKSFTLSGLSIANGAAYYLKWTYTGNGGSTNSQGTGIDNFSITSTGAATVPTLITNANPAVIGTTTATLGGNVTADGGSTVTGRGIVWAVTATNPAPALLGSGVTDVSTTGTTGNFSVSATGLPVNTQISYNAYASNSIGTGYGIAQTFYTLANVPNAPVVSNATSSSLDVTIGAGDGNPAATNYAIRETNSNTYVQANGSLGVSAVFQTATAWGTKTLTGLSQSTSYTFQVQAANGATVATAFGATAGGTTLASGTPTLESSAIADFGNVCTGITTAAHTFTISGTNLTTADVTVATLSGFSFSTDDVTYSASLTLPNAGGTFSALIYVKFSPTLVQSYNSNVSIGGGGAPGITEAVTGSGVNTVPSVTTGGSSAAQVSATLNGSITDAGCTSVTAYGIEYSTLNGFANGTGTAVPSGNLSLGSFSSSVSGLAPATTYYYKAYATNGGGTGYGTQQSFTTLGLDAPVAVAATAVSGTSFDANWQAVPGATSYRLDVSTSPTFANSNATDLFISEYLEGSATNKYIEIYNGTGASVNLSDYKLQLYTNGSSTVSQEITLSGTLANGSTIVYKNSASTVYAGTATTANTVINFNGDDAVALRKISTNSYVDIFGNIGEDPGTAWTSGSFSTVDKTLVRNANVSGGVTVNPGGTGFPTLATEWTQFNIDVASNLGSHTYSASNPSFVTGYNNLTVNGLTQTVSGLTPNTTYYYRVRAFSPSSTSANSNVISVLTECSANVTASSNGNGTVTPTGVTNYNCGESPVFSITANSCYTIADVLVDGVSVGAVSSYTFTNITAGAHTIQATFALSSFNINASAGTGGTISPNGSSSVNCGSNASYTITPDACYSISDVLVDGLSVGAVNNYTFTNVTEAHTIVASFTLTNYTITVTQPGGGSINPGSGTVACGGDATYTFTAAPCYTLTDVIVDGSSVGAVASYTFTNVQENGHTITAVFSVTTYTITATAGANGSIAPGTGSVNCGSDASYTITPAACYHVNDVLVDGVSVGAVTSYTFTNVQATHTISASFTINASLAAPVVTGTVNVCANIGNDDLVVYTANSAGATSYNWILPPNVALQSQTSNSITVKFNVPFGPAQANKQIKVTALSPCGNSPQVIYYLQAQAPVAPQPISGNTNVCPIVGTASTYTYTIPPVPGAATYTWAAQAGNTNITHPNGPGVNDTIVEISFTNGFTNSALTVFANNGCGSSATRSLSLVKPTPSVPGLITGPNNVCANIAPTGSAAVYSVPAVAGVTYNWSVPGSPVGLTGQGTASISFTYGPGFTTGTISVTASNGCGTSAARTLLVKTLPPSTPSAIDVIETAPCPNRVYTYSVAGIPANATSVQWTVPVSALSFTGQGTASIAVSYPTTAVTGTVTATAVSNCGSSSTRSLAVKLAVCEDGPPPPPGPRTSIARTKTPAVATETMQVNVFPNPTVSDFKLQVVTAGTQKMQVRILDMQGRSFKQLTIMPNQAINIGSDLKGGTYMLEVRKGDEVKVTRVVKF